MPIWIEYICELFKACVADGISYLEVRMPLFFK